MSNGSARYEAQAIVMQRGRTMSFLGGLRRGLLERSRLSTSPADQQTMPAEPVAPPAEAPLAEPAHVQVEAPPLPVARGLDWGRFLFRFDYDYQPAARPLETSRGGRRLAARIARDADHIFATLAAIAAHADVMARIGVEADPADPSQPHWGNGWLPGLDAATLYTLIATRRPAHYLEVGSGNSTKFVRRAIRDHGLATRILSIDPEPRAEVDQICDEVIRTQVESVSIEAIADRLRPGDVAFVDNSHRGFQGSDVTVCMMELMPALPAGTLFGVHDICLPYDYDPCFREYFYNEQYYLGMYLLGGATGDRVVMPAYHASHDPIFGQKAFQSLGRAGVPEAARGGSSFWLELGAKEG